MSKELPLRSNIPDFSVSELAFSLKKTLEDNYGRVRVRGELSRVSIPKSGHLYTSLKDDQSVIDAICWKGVLSKLSIKPEEGLEVICTGRITTYPARSNYQMIIESMELAGEGALLKMLEERKKKLASEGLFAIERKRKIPFLPNKIGVVTSPTGAVIRDILHRLSDRFPRHVIVWPVKVQGEGAAVEITNAINGFNALPISERPDLLIVARGGGSLEDLMPFNEENVVRAAAECSIPLISAVGHETDTTLIDYVADLRAPTPTGAAEKAVPVRLDLMAQTTDNHKRLIHAVRRVISEKKHKLEAYNAKLGDPRRLLEMKTQSLDHTAHRLNHSLERMVSQKKQNLSTRAGRLTPPKAQIKASETRLAHVTEKLTTAQGRLISDKNIQLNQTQEKLELLSFENVLKRGYVVIRDENNMPVSKADTLSTNQNIQLQFAENKKVNATIGRNQKTPPSISKKKEQGSLF